jgi:hypothetical protein
MTAAGIALAAAAALVIILANQDGRAGANTPVVLSVILSLAFVVASLRQRAPHMLALAGVAIVLGFAFGAIDRGWTAVNWMFVALGVVTSAIGGFRLGLFLRRHPRPSESA